MGAALPQHDFLDGGAAAFAGLPGLAVDVVPGLVAAALAVVHEHVRTGNVALADGTPAEATAALVAVQAMLDVLGLDPVRWAGAEGDSRTTRALASLVEAGLAVRARARADRDWAAADAVRDRLAAAGVVVEDSPTGPRWSIGGEA